MDDTLLSSQGAARSLGLSAKTVLRAVQRGALTPAQRTPGGHLRFRQADLDAYARGRVAATPAATPSPASNYWIDTVLATVAYPTWVYDRQTLRFLAVNDVAIQHYGYTREEFLARRITAILPASEIEALLDDVERGREHDAGPTARPWQHLTKDGRLLQVVVSPQSVTYAGRPATLILAHDITAAFNALQGLDRFQALFKAMPLPTYTWRQEGEDWTLVDYNDAAVAITDGAIARLVGRSARALYGDMPLVLDEFARCAREGIPIHREMPWQFSATGRDAVLAVTYVPVPPDLVLVQTEDITARRRAEEALRTSEERFRALSEGASDLVTLLDRDGTIHYASPSHRPLLGYDPTDLEGTDAFARMHPDDVERVRMLFANNLRGGGTRARYEFRYRHADGSWRTLEAAGVNRLDDPEIRGFIVNSRDVTERKEAEQALVHQALHDGLTGLPNRTLLTDRLEQSLLTAARAQGPVALLLLDLDRFKEVNDTFGHHHGDLLLQQVAQRLGGLVRETDTVARLGGDEFAVVLPGAETAVAVRVAHQIIAATDTPFALDGHTIFAGASIGIALYPTHGADATTLMRRADVAMYLAKRTQSGYAVYDAAQDQHSPQRIAQVTALLQAIGADGLLLHYQPQLALVNGPPRTQGHSRQDQRRVVAVEALVRWRHPERGLIPPDEFIPLAEGTGLIKGLTERVLDLALAQCHAWRRSGLLLPVAVNLSAWTLHDPHLVQTVAALLQAHGVPPAWLRLEMTESAIMADAERAVAVLSELVALGVRVAVDDYGTGYSSLAYLKRLPVDELKIDKSFVRDMARDETDAAIVRSTVGLAHTLGLRAVAEGVEDEETWAQLVAMGCDAAQGYFISRPVPADDLDRWLRATGEVAADQHGRRG